MASRRFRPSASRLAMLLVAVTVLPSTLLVWFGIRLAAQDEELVRQRDFERRQAAAPVIVSNIQRLLADAEHSLISGDIPAATVRLRLTARAVTVEPRQGAAWLPVVPALPEATDDLFANAESIEQRNPAAALEEYEALARSESLPVRAGALLRVARVLRDPRSRDLERALAAYRAMSRIEGAAVLGAPADLQGRRWAIEILQLLERRDEAVKESEALERDVRSNRWSLDGGTWGLVAKVLQDVTGRVMHAPTEARLVSELADTLARERADGASASSRRLLELEGEKALAIVAHTSDQTVALVIGRTAVGEWLRVALAAVPATGASIRLLSSSGTVWTGAPPAEGRAPVTVNQADSGLPWTVAIDSGDVSDLEAAFSGRRRFFAAGVALVIVMLGIASVLVWRAVQRQIEIARLHADFVATVSHEFRTPLASLRHVTDLLEESDDLPPARRSQFYRTLGRNTDRLHRLVEALLDFSRMEAGRKPYDLRSTDVSALACRVVEEFRQDISSDTATITFRNGGPARARADTVSLATALWNLLDNAVKYSDGHASIAVGVAARANGGIAVSIADTGLGIPPQEREAIFEKFVRGADAGRLGIKGTGLGLALVSHIVSAHDGTIEVESRVGSGSTFTIVLPEERRG
jgi:signal transduction histidine kinase